MDCRLTPYLRPSWLRCFSFTFKYFCVTGGSQFKAKTFLMTASEKAYHCVSFVRFAFSNPPQMVIKIWPYPVYKMHPCSFFVSLHQVWCFSGFELFKFTIFFLSSWNREILEVSWFEIERNNFLDFTPTKGVEENCCIINCKYFQGFKRKTGRLESFKMTSLDRRNVGIQYSDGTLFIYFILSFMSVYSFIGLFDAYPIVDIKPV